MTEIRGRVDDAFAMVRDQFEKNFADGKELGASVAVTVDGVPVVNLWAGDATPAGDPWVEDTVVNVYSTTKTMAALCVLMCVDRGLVDVKAPVADYWPEFAAGGKQNVLVEHVMSHSAGLSGFDPPVAVTDIYDWDATVAHLAAQSPWWEPGSQPGYHAITQGFLQGEIVRRVTGSSIGAFFAAEVAEPLGADFHIGLDAAHDHRVGELVPPDQSADELLSGADPDSIASRTGRSCPLDATEPRTREWRAAEIPAAGGVGNARSVARVHSAIACGGTVDGVQLLSMDTIDLALQPVVAGTDLVMGQHNTFGLGYGLQSEAMPLPNDRTLFWGGWGGSVAIIDTENRMSIAYVMNRMGSALMGDTRGTDLVMAAYGSLLSA